MTAAVLSASHAQSDAHLFEAWLATRPVGVALCACDFTDEADAMQLTPNRVGALFNGAHRRGLIFPIGFHQSSKPSRNRGVHRVWEHNTTNRKEN